MTYRNLEDSCRDACLAVGVEFKHVPNDGRWHCADLVDDPRGRNDGRIRVFPDQKGGQVWNHKSQEKKTFFLAGSSSSQQLTPAERKRIEAERRNREAKRLRTQNLKAYQAAKEFDCADRWPFVPTGYMVRKELMYAHCARRGRFDRKVKCDDGEIRRIVVDDVLLVPVLNSHGQIRNIQYIFPEPHPALGRDKTFIFGAELAGCFSRVGAPSDLIFIAEGYATAVSLHHDTGHRVYIAFSASNLLHVGKIVRELHPDNAVIYCADNDDKTDGNPGVTKATEAAAEIDAKVYIPSISGDYNDLYVQKRRLERERDQFAQERENG